MEAARARFGSRFRAGSPRANAIGHPRERAGIAGSGDRSQREPGVVPGDGSRRRAAGGRGRRLSRRGQ
jgi:hypothetical protein